MYLVGHENEDLFFDFREFLPKNQSIQVARDAYLDHDNLHGYTYEFSKNTRTCVFAFLSLRTIQRNPFNAHWWRREKEDDEPSQIL
jgi:hypothetical protein